MDATVEAWLEALPPALGRHRAVLRRLVGAAEQDPRWRWVELDCSVARGAGDAHSDLDLGLGVAETAWPAALDDVPALAGRLGQVVGLLSHQIAAWGDRPHRRTFVQYADGVQLDLVAVPAASRKGLPPDAVALYDPDGRLAVPWRPASISATPADVREWAFLGWVALANLAKYLRRGSVWEALEHLDEARGHAWRLWAVVQGADHPLFGLTSVLDTPGAALPPGIEATVAGLDPGDLHRAALACAAVLDQAAARAAAALRAGPEAALPAALAAYVHGRLERLTEDEEGRSSSDRGRYPQAG